MLHVSIEEILFNEEQLAELKELINKLYDNSLTPKEFKTYILKQLAKNQQKLLELYPYYIKQIKISNSLSQYTRETFSSELRKELQEKEKLLEKIGIRVNHLVDKLNQKLQG